MSLPAPRLPWPPGFPDVVVQQSSGSSVRLKEQPGYEAAKRQYDVAAAFAVVEAMVDPRSIAVLRAIVAGRPAVIVPVEAEENGRNALPIAYADAISHALGLPLGMGIVQINRTFRTGADSAHRLLARASFDGEVQRGQHYVIVDDVVTQGGTLADLRSYIEGRGGKVIAASALAGSSGSHVLALRPDTLAALRERFGGVESEYQGAFGHGYDGLTDSEARAILRFGMVDAFRDRILAPATARRRAATGSVAGGSTITGGSPAIALAPSALPAAPGNAPPMLVQGVHRYLTRVYYEDTDAAGVVYYANYLKLVERARTEALRDMGVPHADLSSQHGLMFMVRRANLDYLKPARLDDSLVIATRTLSAGAALVELRQTVFRSGDEAEPLVVADIQLACVRQSDMRAARMPPRWRDALRGLSPS